MKVTFIRGPQILMTVKTIKEELHIGLKEAKYCVDSGQFECTKEQLEAIKPKLIELGNTGFEVMN